VVWRLGLKTRNDLLGEEIRRAPSVLVLGIWETRRAQTIHLYDIDERGLAAVVVAEKVGVVSQRAITSVALRKLKKRAVSSGERATTRATSQVLRYD